MELYYHTVSFSQLQPAKVTSAGIKSCARQLVNISLVNKKSNQIFSGELATLKKINDLVNKYRKYNDDYPSRWKDWKGNPQLLDALFTGCSLLFAESTFKTYTPEIEQDIKDIIKLTPQSMNCILGTLRCRDDIPPLAAACFNVNIPLDIVEFLLQQGANPNATLKFNGHPISILADLEVNLDAERFEAIQTLFNKYGAV